MKTLIAEAGPRLAGAARSQPYRLAVISNLASSLVNFRGPLLREMAERGVTIYALAPDYDAASRAAVVALGALPVDSSMARTGMNPLRDLLDVARLALQLRRLKLDASFAYFIKPVIYGTLAARLAGVPRRFAMIEGAGYVFTEQETPSWRRAVLRRMVTWLYRLGLSQAQHVFMLNPDDRKLFIDEGMLAAYKVQLINGIGLDLEHYRPASLAAHPACFLLVGRLLREKGIYEYVEAVRQVKRLHPQVRCLLLGSVDLNPGSIPESEVRGWVAEGLLEWPGQVADVRTWIAQANVFVLPSYREGLPRSTQEVMAMGRPVITTDVPGCRETVLDGVNGFMVPVRDATALARAMLRIIEQPDLVTRMGAESRRMAEEKFDVHKINAQILLAMGL